MELKSYEISSIIIVLEDYLHKVIWNKGQNDFYAKYLVGLIESCKRYRDELS